MESLEAAELGTAVPCTEVSAEVEGVMMRGGLRAFCWCWATEMAENGFGGMEAKCAWFNLLTRSNEKSEGSVVDVDKRSREEEEDGGARGGGGCPVEVVFSRGGGGTDGPAAAEPSSTVERSGSWSSVVMTSAVSNLAGVGGT